ncbi:MAG: phosphorylcholine transferase LicD [Christensenellales bacterium]|jgi:lipopolysaccharide biosynthesis protein
MAEEKYSLMSNRCFGQFKLSDSGIEKLHKTLIVIMDDIDFVCRKFGIIYMLGGGSCLGAVRHKGFIPWDDDIDIMMYYNEMLCLGKRLKEEFGDKYEIYYPLCSVGAGRMMKIFLNGTSFVEISKENMPLPNKIFIDVFPIIPLPSSKFKRKLNGAVHKFAARMYSYGLMSKYPSDTMLKISETDNSLKKYYAKRRRIGRFARIFFGLRFWKFIILHYEKNRMKKTYVEGIPSGIDYNREVFEKGFFTEVKEAEFEGRKYFIPSRYDEYLINLYKDYMQIPPPEKRECHYAVEIDFGEYIFDEVH